MSLLCIAVKKARLVGNLGQCNTYVSLKLQNVKSTTVTVKGNNPSWEQDFIFETNRMDTGLVIEVWNKGVLWDKLVGCHWLPLLNIQYSNEEGDGKWISLDAELVMKDGEVIGTKNPTGSTILVDARFELPYDLQDAEAMELQRKLEVLNTIMDQEIVTLKEQSRRATLSMHSGMSEDSDYTSDVNYPVGQYANSSASQYRRHVGLLSDRSADDGLQNSYERDYAYDAPNSVEDVYNDGRRSDTESEPLYYNSRPRNQANYSYSPPRYSSANVSRQSTQDYATEDVDRDYPYEEEPRLERRPASRRPSASEHHVGRRPSLERQTSFDHEHLVGEYADFTSTYHRYPYRDDDYYYAERGEDNYYDERPPHDPRWPSSKDSVDSRGGGSEQPKQQQQQQRQQRDVRGRWNQEPRSSDLEDEEDDDDLERMLAERREKQLLPLSSRLPPTSRTRSSVATAAALPLSTSSLIPESRIQEASDYHDSFETDFPGGEALPPPPPPPIVVVGRRDPIPVISVPDVIVPLRIEKPVDIVIIPMTLPEVLDTGVPKPTPRIRWLSAFNKVCAQLNVSGQLLLHLLLS